MNLIWFLVRASWMTVAIAALTGSLSGACSTLLIASINNAISSNNLSSNQLLWSFIGLAFVTLLTRILSQFLLVSLSQEAVYKLRLRLSGWILSCPLRHLEEVGANCLLATLTDDILSISRAVFDIPFVCINIALVMGCLAYLGWLSWAVFLVTLVFIDLSQGQRKRLALLTAYLENRPIYLFDEWASDQDPFFREIFYKQLLPELKHKGKTVLVISHDDRYFHLADRMIKLDYGKLV